MNYLAHIYLSGEDPGVIFGNFIGDSVKGKDYDLYPENIRKGILLHRNIDTYTDAHAIPLLARERMREVHGKYAGVVLDMLYDHYLGIHWSDYHSLSLENFSLKFYQSMEGFEKLMPKKMRLIFPHMKANNWLLQYSRIAGLDRAYKGLAKRTKYDSGMEIAIENIKKHYIWYEKNFHDFFPDLIEYSALERSL